jgi:hypothetical protein
MALLKLPSNASTILAQHHDFSRENARLPVYTLPGIAQHKDIEELCQIATESYLAGEGEGEDPTITFLSPAPVARLSPGDTVQEILDAHVASLSTSFSPGDDDSVNRQSEEPEKNQFFPFAFIVVEDSNWRINGVTVVCCHDDDDFVDEEDIPANGDFWRVDECEVSLLALVGVCRDMVLDREVWSTIDVYVGRPTRRTGSKRYLAERTGAWNLESVSSSMARWS